MTVGVSPEDPYLYGLGTMVPPGGFNIDHDLTQLEWTRLDEAVGAIEQLAPPFHYVLVERNFRQLQELHQFVSIVISLGKQFAVPNRKQLVESVMAGAVNWLTSMRMFLDHEATHLKRQYGDNSAQFVAFKAATKKAYDGNVGYRFAYEFRNYVQHCGLPLNHISITPPATPDKLLQQDARLLLDRDILLAQFGNWKRAKADLRAMQRTFAFLPLLDSAMVGLRDINRVCQEIDLDKALASAPIIATALSRLEGLEGEPMLFRYQESREGIKITPRPLYASSVGQLQAVNEGRAARQSLWRLGERPPPPPLPLDPAVVRSEFHRDSRGVQIVSAWLQEGGGTPRFFDAVNQLLEEDQGIEPVLTGLINTTVLFAHMTAGALGTTAEALIGGILDRYSQIDASTLHRGQG
jgi:hypothetical protein